MSGHFPAAPYPPIVQIARDRAISFSGTATGSKVSNKMTTSTTQSNRGSAAKDHPGRAEFYNSFIYGGVNCLEHSYSETQQNDSSIKDKAKKVGPILLSLGMFSPNETQRFRTFAISRGNTATLGAGVASTCLSFRKTFDVSGNRVVGALNDPIHCATGLTTGTLIVHTFKNITDYLRVNDTQEEDAKYWSVMDSSNSEDIKSSVYSYYQPRHHRPCSSVSWGTNARHVAVGIVSSNSLDSSYRTGSARGGTDSQAAGGSGGKDRDYGALVFDVEFNVKGSKSTPINRLAHNSGVSSICWMSNGQSLAVGCQQRYVSIYDLRASGASVPPRNIDAHDGSVNGIEVDPSNPYIFATFSRGLAEPVKLWDSRRPDLKLSDIKLDSSAAHDAGEYSFVSGISWVPSCPGLLGVVVNENILYYDTYDSKGITTRPTLSRMTNSQHNIQDIAFLPETKFTKQQLFDERPERMIVVEDSGIIRDLPLHQIAPAAISPRDGRVVHALRNLVMSRSSTSGASAMEKSELVFDGDISATMMWRARCLHSSKYSTDAKSNLEMIHNELESHRKILDYEDKQTNAELFVSREQLLRLWSWIDRVESIIFRKSSPSVIDERRLPAKSLIDAGAYQLLKLDDPNSDEISTFETNILSPLFNRTIFDSPMRRAVLTSCGWIGQFNRTEVLAAIESEGHYERSAALAVWNSDLGEAVAALQRGAENMRKEFREKKDAILGSYSETLDLVAMCIAGYSGGSKDATSRSVWEKACKALLSKPDLNISTNYTSSQRSAYLAAICSFLIDVEQGIFTSTLNNEMLSLSDRVAFACIFLSRKDLKGYLESCVLDCINRGNLEGMFITGMNKQGVRLLQSYVDIYSDVQTCALVSARVIIPSTWSHERMICSEWLQNYRDILNTWQFWQSRSLFDVGRIEQLRKLKERQQADENFITSIPGTNIRPARRATSANKKYQQFSPSSTMKSNETDSILQPIPQQLHARCNYCNTSLALSKLIQKQDGSIANNWLSRQNPVLSCCPNSQCRKPLPRCAICLLPLGCLNPYLELRKHGLQSTEDLSELKSLPFSEWFTWCMRCKHGGHAHHIQEWFGSHTVCPVSNCSCKCEFDGIQKLKRVGGKEKK